MPTESIPREDMRDLSVLVTGASSGIGAAICRRIAEPGMKFVIHARGGEDGGKRKSLLSVAEELREKGAKVETGFEDLTVAGSGRRLVDLAIDSFGALDQIVSNAGFAERGVLGEVDRASLERAHSGMAGAFFEIASAAIEHLKKSPCGRVVVISSFVAHYYTPDTLFPATAAAKSSVEALARTLAVQLGPHDVTVNCVAPGYTQKDEGAHRAISREALQKAAGRALTGRIAQPDDIAAAVQFLLSEDARQITGQVLRVDGGLGITA